MTLLAPAFLALLGLAIPILLLYMLKLRRREVRVSSLHLWEKVLRDREANSPWQRLRRNLLLILQLMFIGLITLALSRPAIPTSTLATGSLIVLLDGSASMQAEDITPDRFSAALEEVKNLILDLQPASRMTLILINDHPEVLAAGENDRSYLLEQLEGISASNTIADWPTAAALAVGANQHQENPATTVFITDGGLGNEPLPPIPGEVRYIAIGNSGENAAVTHMAVELGPGGAQLYAQITNYGQMERSVVASVYRDAELIHARQLMIPGGENQALILEDLPIEPAIFEVRLGPTTGDPDQGDQLALDDRSSFPLRANHPNQGLLVTPGNFFLEQLLGAYPDISFLQALGGNDFTLADVPDRYDLIVFDGLIPPDLPNGNYLFINPPPNELFTVGASAITIEGPVRIADSQITNHISWTDVHVRTARSVELPIWGQSLVSSGEIPLVFTGENDGRRIGVITFDLFESDLPLNTAFPILMANLFEYLTPTDPLGLPPTMNAGESLRKLSEPAFEQTTLTTPTNEMIRFQPGSTSVQQLTLSEPGIYTIQTTVDNVEYVEYVAVNFQSPIESQITPGESIKIGASPTLPQQPAEVGKRELWPTLVLLGFLILAGEWWISNHGQLSEFSSVTQDLWKKLARATGFSRNKTRA